MTWITGDQKVHELLKRGKGSRRWITRLCLRADRKRLPASLGARVAAAAANEMRDPSLRFGERVTALTAGAGVSGGRISGSASRVAPLKATPG